MMSTFPSKISENINVRMMSTRRPGCSVRKPNAAMLAGSNTPMMAWAPTDVSVEQGYVLMAPSSEWRLRGLTKLLKGHLSTLILLLLLLGQARSLEPAKDNHYLLIHGLLEHYDPSVRPVLSHSEPMTVIFDMALHQIIDVDEKNQIFSTNCWLTQRWRDHHLTWNASDYGGIQVIRLPHDRVWKPDIILYNNADPLYNLAVINTNVIVNSDGNVTWLSHGIYRSSCEINVEYFPFDVQRCKMKWASWTYDGYQVDIQYQQESGELSNYQTNGEFHLEEFVAIRNVINYSCCPEPYPDITYEFSLRRRPLFYVFNLILPCVLITCIALLVFYVPPESGEKVTLGISALLSMTVFLMTIRESLPPTEKTPLISLYYGATICIVSFATGLSVVTLHIHHRGARGTDVPKFLRKGVLEYLAKFVLMKNPWEDCETRGSTESGNSNGLFGHKSNKSNSSHRHEAYKRNHSNSRGSATSVSLGGGSGRGHNQTTVSHNNVHQTDSSRYLTAFHHQQNHETYCSIHAKPLAPNICDMDAANLEVYCSSPKYTSSRLRSRFRTANYPSCRRSSLQDESPDTSAEIAHALDRLSMALERFDKQFEQTERQENQKRDWQKVAFVCDRFLLYVFVIVTAVASCVILFSSPHGPIKGS